MQEFCAEGLPSDSQNSDESEISNGLSMRAAMMEDGGDQIQTTEPGQPAEASSAPAQGQSSSSSDSTSTSSDSSSKTQSGDGAPGAGSASVDVGQGAGREAIDDDDGLGLEAYTALSRFRITPKSSAASGGSGGRFGGFSGVCPLHRKSGTTQCKKWSPLLGASPAHKRAAKIRLLHWLAQGPDHNRQRHHVAMPLVQDVSDISLPDLRERLRAIVVPEPRCLDDRTLDSREGIDPSAAPKRVASKRVARRGV